MSDFGVNGAHTKRTVAAGYIDELRGRGFGVCLDWNPETGHRGLHILSRDREHLATLDEEDAGSIAWLREEMEQLLEERLDVRVG